MFLFGHLGIGSEMVRPFSRGLALRWILLGSILPDLIDKPIYYTLKLVTQKSGPELFLIHGTRSIAHTGLFTLSLALIAFTKRSKLLAALCLGSLSHLLLDAFSFYLPHSIHEQGQLGEVLLSIPILWPLKGWDFPLTPFSSLWDQLHQIQSPYTLGFEVVGVLLLFFRTSRVMRALKRLPHIQP